MSSLANRASAAAGVVLVALAAAAALGADLLLVAIFASAAWVVALCRASRRSALAVLVVAVLLRIPFLFVDFHSNDLYRYVFEGRIQLAGQGFSPFALAPSDPSLEPLRDAHYAQILEPDLPTVYPPLAQALFAATAAVGSGEYGLRNLLILVDILVVVALLGWLVSTGRPPGWALVYAWAPVAVAGAAAGHVDPLMLLFLVGFAWSWERRRVNIAAALLAAAVLSKSVAVALLPWLLVRRPRAALAVTLPLVFLGYLPYALLGGVGSLTGSLGTFATEFAFNASLFRVLELLHPAGAPGLAALLFMGWVGWLALSQPRVASAWALALAGLLVLAPTVHYWYLSWFLAALPGTAGFARGSLPGPSREGPTSGWRAPLLAWCVGIVALLPVYLSWVRGEAGAPASWSSVLAYALPTLLVIAQLPSLRMRLRTPLEAHASGAPEGRVAVVIPARGEAESLRELLPAWLETRVADVIVVDLPSGDDTGAICAALPRVAYVPLRRRGYGAAVSTGLAVAAQRDADFVVICDADHSEGPMQLDSLLAPLVDPRISLVCAARAPDSPQTRTQRAGNWLTSLLIALAWGRRFRDLGPYRALRLASWRDVAMIDRGFGWNVEMNVRALQEGLGVAEPVLPSRPRVYGRNRISGSWRGAIAAGLGMLTRLHRLREAA